MLLEVCLQICERHIALLLATEPFHDRPGDPFLSAHSVNIELVEIFVVGDHTVRSHNGYELHYAVSRLFGDFLNSCHHLLVCLLFDHCLKLADGQIICGFFLLLRFLFLLLPSCDLHFFASYQAISPVAHP